MATSYNLSKVYEISTEKEFVNDIIGLIVKEIPESFRFIDEGMREKDYNKTYSYAHKVKPSLELIGLPLALTEILKIETLAKKEEVNEEMKTAYNNAKKMVDIAIEEIKKDFAL